MKLKPFLWTLVLGIAAARLYPQASMTLAFAFATVLALVALRDEFKKITLLLIALAGFWAMWTHQESEPASTPKPASLDRPVEGSDRPLPWRYEPR